MQISFLFGASADKCRENLWFNCRRFEIWLVNTGHVKTKGVGKLDSFEHIHWCSSTKADKYSSCYLFLPCQSRWFISTKQIIILFWVIIYSYLQSFFKIGVLKTLYTMHRKTTVSESLFNHLVSFLIKDSDIDAFLWILQNCQEHLEAPDFVFIEYVCNYNIIKFSVN